MGRLANSSPTPPAIQGIEEDVRSNFRGLGIEQITMDNAQVSSHVAMVQYTERRDALWGRIEANKDVDPQMTGPFWQEEFHDAFARIATGERMIERCREVQRMHWLHMEGRIEESMRIREAIQERMAGRRQGVEDEMEDSDVSDDSDDEDLEARDSEDSDNEDLEDSDGSSDPEDFEGDDSDVDDYEIVLNPEADHEDVGDYGMVQYNENEQSSEFEYVVEDLDDYEMLEYNENDQEEDFENPEFEYEQLEHEQFEIVYYGEQMEKSDDEEIDVVN
ncbi:Protein CBG09128 [Caenorhabditis briggsae]|uniref:Protein CBG09128 n=2 Tax=Caenorhabditis briggsae TaxID=6238 RepID=A8X856_CAEBR|nr:Protein CBG09128 [Caenorhabditis briggsae]ULU02708.1 hypothetical protein L3Y34_002359 [Caenorhabditis briggsae]CAP28817.1 Protein CBG09128 [Caenorhabditis briggsae]